MKKQVITQTVKSGTIIGKCPFNCNHAYQDEKYGKGQRVLNITASGKGRCTVCGKVEVTK